MIRVVTAATIGALIAWALVSNGQPAAASHPFPATYLWQDLIMGGDGRLQYNVCGDGTPGETYWDDGPENWDGPIGTTIEFDSSGSCTQPGANTFLQWEEFNSVPPLVCGETDFACWVIWQSTDRGSYIELNLTRIAYDRDKYSVSTPSVQIALSAHEWGHNLSLDDDLGQTDCTVDSIMAKTQTGMCKTGPTTADVYSVKCIVYKLCAGARVAAGDLDGDGCDEIVTAPGSGANRPLVRVWDAPGGGCITSTISLRAQFLAYADGFSGGVYVAVGNVDTSDTRDEIITGTGVGGVPEMRRWRFNLINSVTELLPRKMVYETAPPFLGGVRVGAGNRDCTAGDEMMTAPGPGRAPEVRTWRSNLTQLGSYNAYPGFNIGAFVAGGNMATNNCGDEIVTGPDSTGGSHVRIVCCSTGGDINSFFAYPGFTGGVRVATSNVSEPALFDTPHEIVTGAGPGGTPHVRVWNTNGAEVLPGGANGFMAYDTSFNGGVYVAGANLNGLGSWEVVTGAGEGGSPHVRIWTCCGATVSEVVGFFAY